MNRIVKPVVLPYLRARRWPLVGNNPFKGGGVPLRVVATRGELCPGVTGSARISTNVKGRYRKRAFIGAGGLRAGSAVLALSAFTGNGTISGETAGAQYTVEAHIEIAGIAYPFTWGGASSGVVGAGAALVQSDVNANHPEVAAGTEVFFLISREYAIGAQPFFHQFPSPGIAGEAAHQAPSGVSAGIGTPGAISATGGWSSSASNFDVPFVLLGKKITSAPSILVLGASIEAYLNDNWGDGANGAGGYVRRGLAPGAGTKYAFISAASPGESANEFLAGSSRRQQYLQFADTVLIGHGGNDFSDGRTAVATLADISAIKDIVSAAGIQKIGFMRLAPKTDSTDNWTTTGNQTIRSGFLTFRQDIDDGVVANGMSLVDVTAGHEQSGMPGIWKADGVTAALSTADGTHPKAVRHADAGSLLQPAMGSLLT